MGQIANVVEDNENGLLVPAGDADAMANAINRLIADPELRAHLVSEPERDCSKKSFLGAVFFTA